MHQDHAYALFLNLMSFDTYDQCNKQLLFNSWIDKNHIICEVINGVKSVPQASIGVI